MNWLYLICGGSKWAGVYHKQFHCSLHEQELYWSHLDGVEYQVVNWIAIELENVAFSDSKQASKNIEQYFG